MDCRHIDESEVRTNFNDGEINYAKSKLKNKPCPKYDVEKTTHKVQESR